MSEETIKLLIQAAPAIITALAALAGAIFAGLSFLRSGKNAAAISRVEAGVNGQTRQLLKVTGEAEHAKGVKEEFDREKS